MEENVKIKQASVKDNLFLTGEYSRQLPNDDTETNKFNRTTPVHDDLIKTFKKLNKHLALLCEQIVPAKKIKDFDNWSPPEMLVKQESQTELPIPGTPEKDPESKFHIIGFSIKGNGDNEGCVISGYMIGKYGIVDLTTPRTDWEDKKYPYISELASDIQGCIYEVEQYLFHDKRAPDRQLAMDFEGQNQEDI